MQTLIWRTLALAACTVSLAACSSGDTQNEASAPLDPAASAGANVDPTPDPILGATADTMGAGSTMGSGSAGSAMGAAGTSDGTGAMEGTGNPTTGSTADGQ